VTGVNTLYNALLAEEWFTAFPPRHLKAAGGGGASMHAAVVERFEKLTGAPLVDGVWAHRDHARWFVSSRSKEHASKTPSAYRFR